MGKSFGKILIKWTPVYVIVFALWFCGCNLMTQPQESVRVSHLASVTIHPKFEVAYSIETAKASSNKATEEKVLAKGAALRTAAGKVIGEYFTLSWPLSGRNSQHAVIVVRDLKAATDSATSSVNTTRFIRSARVLVSFVDNAGTVVASSEGTGSENAVDSDYIQVALESAYMRAIEAALDKIFRQKSPDVGWMLRLKKGKYRQSGAGASGIAEQPISSSGTGFFINQNGNIVSAEHVVEGCKNLSIVYKSVEYPVSVLATDKEHDLSVLKTELKPVNFGKLAKIDQLKTGKHVVAFGFPLQGLLAPTPSLTTGIVSNAEVNKGSKDLLQVTTPIQPGNSGGPLIGVDGAIYGVTVASLDSIKLLIETGALPQNVNFAISSKPLQQFLSAKGVPWVLSEGTTEISTVELAEMAKDYTVIVLCRDR